MGGLTESGRAYLAAVPRRELLQIAAAALASVAVVVAYAIATRGGALAGDQIEYDIQGRFFADGSFWWTTTPFGEPHASAWKAPIYPAWVGVVYGVLGESPLRVALVQSLLAPIAVVCTWLLARRLFTPRVAVASAAIVAVFPLIWEYYGLLYSEALAIPLTAITLLLFLGRREPPSGRLVVAVGVVMGLGLLVRPSSGFLFAGVLAAWVVAAGWRRGIALTAAAVAIAALVVAPWTIRNLSVTEGFVPISVQDGAAYGTFNEEAANDPVYPYAWRLAPDPLPEVLARGEPVPEAELRAELQEEALDYIREHPLSVVEAFYWNGLSRFWDVRRPARALDEVDFQGRSEAVTVAGLAMYYVLLPLAIAGLWRHRRRRELLYPILALALGASIVHTTIATTRYRAPIEPLVVIMAGSLLAPRHDRDQPPGPGGHPEVVTSA